MRLLKKLLSLVVVLNLLESTTVLSVPSVMAQTLDPNKTYNVYNVKTGTGSEMTGQEIEDYNKSVAQSSTTTSSSSSNNSSSLTTSDGAKNPFKIDDFIKVSDAKNKDDVTKDKEKYENDLEAVKSKYYSTKNKLFARLVAYDTVNSEGMGNRFAKGTIDTIAGALTGDSISQGLKNLGKVGGAIGDLFLNTWELNVVTNNEDLDEIYEMVKKKYANDPEALKLAEELRTIGREFHSLERKIDALDNISETDGPIYEYITPNGESILFKKVNYSFQSAGEAAFGKYETIDASNAEGCMPLPAKLAETRSCIFCPLFLTIFNAAQTMTTNSFGVLGPEIAKVIFIGLALYIAFLVLKYVSSMTKQDTPRFMNELLTQCFKVVVACVLLYTPDFVYSKIIGPVLDAGTELGGALLFEEGSGYTQWCSIEQNITDQTNEFIKGGEDGTETPLKEGLIPAYIYTKIECFIRAVQAEISLSQSIGSSLMCISRNAAADSVTSVPIPDFTMMFQGLIIWLMAIIMTIAFAFYLIDATVKLGIVGALMPFFIASWPFKATSRYASTGWNMLLNTFFVYALMGLVISINIQLILQGVSAGTASADNLQDLINGNNIDALREALDIGFSGFLILIGSCLFAFKLTGQANSIAGEFANAGAVNIAPGIGTLALSGATGMAKKGLNKVGNMANATGVPARISQAKDRFTSRVAQGLGLGRFAGKAGQSSVTGANTAARNNQNQPLPQNQNPSTNQNPNPNPNPNQNPNQNPDQNPDANTGPQPKPDSRTNQAPNPNNQTTQQAWSNAVRNEAMANAQVRTSQREVNSAQKMANSAKGTPLEAQRLRELEQAQLKLQNAQAQAMQALKNREALEKNMLNTLNSAYNSQQLINDKKNLENSAAAIQNAKANASRVDSQLQAVNQTIQNPVDSKSLAQAQQQKAQLESEKATLDKYVSDTQKYHDNLYNKLSNIAGTEENKQRIQDIQNQINANGGAQAYENSISPEATQQKINDINQKIEQNAREQAAQAEKINRTQQEINAQNALLQDEKNKAASASDEPSRTLYAQQALERENIIRQTQDDLQRMQSQVDSLKTDAQALGKQQQILAKDLEQNKAQWDFYNKFVKPQGGENV